MFIARQQLVELEPCPSQSVVVAAAAEIAALPILEQLAAQTNLAATRCVLQMHTAVQPNGTFIAPIKLRLCAQLAAAAAAAAEIAALPILEQLAAQTNLAATRYVLLMPIAAKPNGIKSAPTWQRPSAQLAELEVARFPLQRLQKKKLAEMTRMVVATAAEQIRLCLRSTLQLAELSMRARKHATQTGTDSPWLLERRSP